MSGGSKVRPRLPWRPQRSSRCNSAKRRSPEKPCKGLSNLRLLGKARKFQHGLLGPFHAGWQLYDASWPVRRPGRLYRRGELRDTKATWAADEPVTRYRLRILLVCPSDEICRCRCDAGDQLRWRGQQDPHLRRRRFSRCAPRSSSMWRSGPCRRPLTTSR